MEKRNANNNIFVGMVQALDSVSFGMSKEREYLLENISLLVSGGLTVLAAIDAVSEETQSRSMRRALKILRDEVESGSALWKAFDQSGLFREHTIALVRIGEESGRLSENLKLIATQEAKEREFKGKIQSAMLYPVFVLGLTVAVGTLIAWFILPRLATVFSQLDVALPLVTQWLIAAGVFLGAQGHVVIPLAVAVSILLIYVVFYFPFTRVIGQTLLFSLPGIKRLIQEVELTRFGYLLGSLLKAGLPITQAIDSLARATSFPHYKKFYRFLKNEINDGSSFQKSFEGYKNIRSLIPKPVQQLVVAGEQSGNLSNTLLLMSDTFEKKLEQSTKNIAVILEPIMLVVVWLGVMGVAFAVILPIYSLIGGFNTDPNSAQPIEAQQELSEEVGSTVSVVSRLRILESAGDFLNVRSEPSTNGEVLLEAQPGQVFEYVGERDGWYEILFEGSETRGWVFAEYVEIITN